MFDSTKLLGLIVVIILLALPERISARVGEKLKKNDANQREEAIDEEKKKSRCRHTLSIAGESEGEERSRGEEEKITFSKIHRKAA